MSNSETDLPRSEHGLREYSFEIGPMDDTSEAVAIVGIEYSSVGFDEKFYRKEEADALIAEKDEEIAALKARNRRLLEQTRQKEHALCCLRSDYALATFRIMDFMDEGNHMLWMQSNKYWKEKKKEFER